MQIMSGSSSVASTYAPQKKKERLYSELIGSLAQIAPALSAALHAYLASTGTFSRHSNQPGLARRQTTVQSALRDEQGHTEARLNLSTAEVNGSLLFSRVDGYLRRTVWDSFAR